MLAGTGDAQCSASCLVQSRCSVSIGWMNEYISKKSKEKMNLEGSLRRALQLLVFANFSVDFD